MIQELVNKLVAEAGLNAEQASKAVNVMVAHVKSIVPAPFASNIEAMLQGQTAGAAAGFAANTAPKEEGLMDKAKDMAGQAKDKLEDLAGDAKEKIAAFTSKENLDNLKDQAEDKFDALKDKAEDLAEDLFAKAKNLFGGDKKDS